MASGDEVTLHAGGDGVSVGNDADSGIGGSRSQVSDDSPYGNGSGEFVNRK